MAAEEDDADRIVVTPLPALSSTNQRPGEMQEPVSLSWKQMATMSLHWRCLTVTLLLAICACMMVWCRIPRNIGLSYPVEPCRNGLIWIPATIFLVFYMLYIIECMHCDIHRDLTGIVSVQDAYRLFRCWSKAKPLIKWKALGYHYGRTVRHFYANGAASAQPVPQLYYTRIDSHTNEGSYNAHQCSSADYSSHLHNLEKHSIIKVDIEKYFSFGCNCSEAAYLSQRKSFYDDNVPADDYIEMHETFHLAGIEVPDSICVVLSSTGLPWYCQKYAFWLFSVICLSWPLRMVMETNTAYASLFIHKRFGARCGSRQNWNSLSSLDSKLSDEVYGVIPSYSEALLMSSYTINGSKVARACMTMQQDEDDYILESIVQHNRTDVRPLPGMHLSQTMGFISNHTRPQRLKRSRTIQLILSVPYARSTTGMPLYRQHGATSSCKLRGPSCRQIIKDPVRCSSTGFISPSVIHNSTATVSRSKSCDAPSIIKPLVNSSSCGEKLRLL